jgi:hypothetical protein
MPRSVHRGAVAGKSEVDLLQPAAGEGRPLGRPSPTLKVHSEEKLYFFLFVRLHLPGVVSVSVVPSW